VASPHEVTGPINLGNPGEFTMIELANKIIQLTNSRSEIVFQPLPQDDPRQRKPDITKAKDALGWEPHVALDEGLERTIAYFDGMIAEGLVQKVMEPS
jgi:UDP-glucuronate decarboxylase